MTNVPYQERLAVSSDALIINGDGYVDGSSVRRTAAQFGWRGLCVIHQMNPVNYRNGRYRDDRTINTLGVLGSNPLHLRNDIAAFVTI